MQRSTTSPYAGSSQMVDKMIGNAYDSVKLVADNLQMLEYLANNMEALIEIASDLSTTNVVWGVAGNPGETTQIPLPTGVDQDSISSMSVLLDNGSGGLYGFESNYFTFHVLNGSLRLTLNPLAPQSLAGASVRWSISHKV